MRLGRCSCVGTLRERGCLVQRCVADVIRFDDVTMIIPLGIAAPIGYSMSREW